jgi:hypothetical protein
MRIEDVILDPTLEAPETRFEEGGATPVAGGMYDGGYTPVQSDSEGIDWPVPSGPGGLFFLDRRELSRGTIERITSKYGLKDVLSEAKPKRVHWKRRKKLRSEKYFRCERKSKLARDKWLTSTPDGLWHYYKRLTTKKGFSWEISYEDFYSIMTREVDSRCIYEYLFNIYRVDKTRKSYTVDSIVIKERYSNIVLYSITV